MVCCEHASPVKPSKQLQVPDDESQVPRFEHAACSSYCFVPSGGAPIADTQIWTRQTFGGISLCARNNNGVFGEGY